MEAVSHLGRPLSEYNLSPLVAQGLQHTPVPPVTPSGGNLVLMFRETFNLVLPLHQLQQVELLQWLMLVKIVHLWLILFWHSLKPSD